MAAGAAAAAAAVQASLRAPSKAEGWHGCVSQGCPADLSAAGCLWRGLERAGCALAAGRPCCLLPARCAASRRLLDRRKGMGLLTRHEQTRAS